MTDTEKLQQTKGLVTAALHAQSTGGTWESEAKVLRKIIQSLAKLTGVPV